MPIYQIHEVANIFPRMSAEEFVQLKADIKENGLREPIWLHEGQIIDGRNRYWACQEVGAEIHAREWDGSGSLTAFVVSLNLHRRHLDESQRAIVGARIKPMFEEEARARMTAGTNQYSPSAERREGSKAAEQAATAVNTSSRSIERATKVIKDGAPELVAAVESGEVSVTAAAEVAKLSKEEQVQIVAKGPEEVKKAAKEKRPEVKPSEARIYEGTTFSALTVTVQVESMLEKIAWKDPNAITALERIAESVQRRIESIKQRKADHE